MVDEKTEVTPPTVVELEGKVSRLTAQVAEDAKGIAGVDEAVKRAMKSGALDEVLAATDKRSALLATFNKAESQLKTAKNAVVSGKRAANAGKIADVHNEARNPQSKMTVIEFHSKLAALGVEWTKIETSEETGKLIFNSGGAEVKRTRGAGGTGSRGQTLTVDGQEFASASAALREFIPEHTSPENRARIISMLTNAGHEVA